MDKKISNQIFAQNVRSLLKENDLNIAKLSEAINIPRTSINNWLNQYRNPNLESLIKLSEFFQLSVDYLIGIEDEFGNKKLY